MNTRTRDPVTSPPLPVPDRIARGQPSPKGWPQLFCRGTTDGFATAVASTGSRDQIPSDDPGHNFARRRMGAGMSAARQSGRPSTFRRSPVRRRRTPGHPTQGTARPPVRRCPLVATRWAPGKSHDAKAKMDATTGCVPPRCRRPICCDAGNHVLVGSPTSGFCARLEDLRVPSGFGVP
jgi:hypothetical protein